MNQLSTLLVRNECGSRLNRFNGWPSRFPQDTGAFPATKIQVTYTFRPMNSKVVGIHEDATELLSFSLVKLHIKNIRKCRSRKCDIGMAARARQSVLMIMSLPRDGDCRATTGGLQAQIACNPLIHPCSFQDSGPVQSASLGRPWRCHRWSQRECRKLQSWALLVGSPISCTNPAHSLQWYQHWNRLPLLMIHGTLPWHPNNNREWIRLHTAVPEWLHSDWVACFVQLHLHVGLVSIMIEIDVVVPNFGFA